MKLKKSGFYKFVFPNELDIVTWNHFANTHSITYLKSSVFTVILVKNNNCIPLHQKFNSISETEVFFVEMHLREPTPLKT